MSLYCIVSNRIVFYIFYILSVQRFPQWRSPVSTIPVHHSSEHAAGPGEDPESGHGEGQPTNRSGAQVSDACTHSRAHAPAVGYK